MSNVPTHRYLVGLILAPALAVLLAAIAGASPTKARTGREGLVAMGVACGLSALATVLGSLPVAWAAIRSPKNVRTLGYSASLVRVLILALLAVVVVTEVELHLVTFLVWLGVSYVVALSVEVVFLVLLIQKGEAHN